jgi:hypothetical protein
VQSQLASLRTKRTPGCITCRSKKVKCDEVHPVCSRCQRLHRNCEWQTVDQSRKEIKHDKAAPIPKKILPNIQSGEKAVSVNSPIQKIRIPNHSSSLSDSSETLETSSICDTVGFKRELDREDAPPEGLGGQYSNALPAIIRAVDLQVPIGPKSSLNFMTPSQIVDCVALAPSFKFTQNESRGLHHFQISLVTPRTTKRNAPWSTLGAVLSLGSQVPMVMHIIIATSLMDLAMCYDYDPKICFKAQTHFKTGAQLLINAMNHGSEPNHVTVLACFYFIHIYMQRRKEMDASAIKQVSRAIVQHIKRYDLDLCCAGTLSPQQQQIRCPGAAGLSPREIELMARIMMLLYYEDVIGCSKGFGGALADHLTARKERMKDIQQISVSSLESFWGAQYPDVEVVDDVEHITILDFLHEIWITNQLVNQYFTSASTYPSEIPDIEAHIAALEQVSFLIPPPPPPFSAVYVPSCVLTRIRKQNNSSRSCLQRPNPAPTTSKTPTSSSPTTTPCASSTSATNYPIIPPRTRSPPHPPPSRPSSSSPSASSRQRTPSTTSATSGRCSSRASRPTTPSTATGSRSG